MNPIHQKILEDFHAMRSRFAVLEKTALVVINEIIETNGIKVTHVDHRLKTETSLAGKLVRKEDRYQTVGDITDLLGFRVICWYADGVDSFASRLEEYFDIDYDNNVDKREVIRADAFGYLSLHYICSLPFHSGFPEEICGIKFEIQIRTVLQHIWAEIEHDLGYKSTFGVPRPIRREFSRVAGLLEIADKEFVEIRDSVGDYNKEVKRRIFENEAQDIPLDASSLYEYMRVNGPMQNFVRDVAAISHAEIRIIRPDSYLKQLQWLKKSTLGDVQKMLETHRKTAFELAEQVLSVSELDLITTNTALYFLCRAELKDCHYSREQIIEFLMFTVRDEKRACRQADQLLSRTDEI